MRKVFVFLLSMILGIFMLIFPSCSSTKDFDEKMNYEKYAKQDAENIFELIKSENVEEIKQYFSQNIIQSHDLNSEISEALDFIEGDIIKYDKISIQASGLGTEKNGEIYDCHVVVQIQGIETSVNKCYTIGIYQQRISKEDINDQGIQIFTIRLLDESGDTVESFNIE